MPDPTSDESTRLRFPEVKTADAMPARKLWVEMATRITTQRLHYRSGDEETAAESIHSLFKTVRELLAAYPPAEAFDFSAEFMLNRVVRPYTARWHRWMVNELFRDEIVRRRFRKELSRLQIRLECFEKLFAELSKGKQPDHNLIKGCFLNVLDGMIVMEEKDGSGLADLGGDLDARIKPQVDAFPPQENGPADQPFVSTREVTAEEHRYIRARRRAMGLNPKTGAFAEPAGPGGEASPPGETPVGPAAAPSDEATVLNATGLCLSGGGIRSATFCLGIVQVLAAKGMFAQFDYLSTVSGGGYLGTFLSSYLGTKSAELRAKLAEPLPPVAKAEKEPDPATPPPGTPVAPPPPVPPAPAHRGTPWQRIEEAFAPRPDGTESAAVRHLRNHSRYLLSGGIWARVQIGGLLVSGVLTNVLVILPLILVAVLIAVGLKEIGYWGGGGDWAGNKVFDDPWHFTRPHLRAETWASGLLLYPGFVLVAGWLGLAFVQNVTSSQPPNSWPAKVRTAWITVTLLLALFTLGTAALFFFPAVVCGYTHFLGRGVDLHSIPRGEKAIGAVTTFGTFVLGPLATHLRSTGWPKKLLSVLFAISGPALMIFLFLFVSSRLLPSSSEWRWEAVAWVAGVLLVWSWFGLNINTHGPHRYYRDRLCECYLVSTDNHFDHLGAVRGWLRKHWHGRPRAERELGTLQRLPLSALGSDPAAPYHLINTTVNLPASQNPNLRGRASDFFVISRHFCGGPICGYVSTATVEKSDPHFDLGTAMAVSGAAASANMGANTLHDFRVLMTLTNIRLGYWLRNPRRPFWWPRPLWSILGAPGPAYLLSEMTGWMHESARYLNLSDGGHIENLALYELLRRRCKYLVVVDAGHEPGMEAADLMLVERYAAIDLGIQMQFDLSDLMLDAKRTSRAYAVLGKVFYEPDKGEAGELGWIVYIKLAFVGGEPGYVADYRRQNPDFPHQSTGQQLYEEAQFEAYRALGEAAAKSLFDDELTQPFRRARAAHNARENHGRAARREAAMTEEPDEVPIESMEDWFKALATSLLPDNDGVFDPSKARSPGLERAPMG